MRPALPRAGGHSLTVTFPRGREGAAATLAYELESDVAGGRPQIGRLAPRVAERARELRFSVPATLLRDPRLASPLLVISNGGPSEVAYAVSAR